MTVEEAVREELRNAYHTEIQLFASFTQALGKPDISTMEVQHRRQQLQEANTKIAELRAVLYGVLEGERIWKERTKPK